MKCSDERVHKIGAKLKEMRIAKGFSSYEVFAFSNDIPRISYYRLEKGTNCKLESLLKILDIHQVSLSEFFSDIDKY